MRSARNLPGQATIRLQPGNVKLHIGPMKSEYIRQLSRRSVCAFQGQSLEKAMNKFIRLIKTSFNDFLVGFLAVLPIIIVMQILIWLASFILTRFFNIQDWIGHYFVAGVVFVAIYALLAYIGHELRKRRSSLVISIFDLFIQKVPFFNTVYRVIKKVLDMFRGTGEQNTREVVYVEYPKDGVWVPAFVTNRVGDRYVLYIPTSPNPTNGFTVIIHESKIVKSELDFKEVTSFVVSVGADFPKNNEALELPR